MDDLGSLGTSFATIDNSGINYAEMNKGVTPIFFTIPVQDFAETEKEGRPRFREMEHVRIVVAGDMLNVGTYPVTDVERERFSEAYRKWKEGSKERHIEGTPLSQCGLLTPIQCKEFEAINIFSVEQLAGVSDTNIQRLPDGRIWREKAIAWLATAKDSAAATRYAAENERLRDDMAEMQKQMDDMAAQIARLTPEAGRGQQPQHQGRRS
jgi:hypothetical protein